MNFILTAVELDFGAITTELLSASKFTLGLFFLTLLFALPLGMVVCACSMSKFKPLAWLTNAFIWIIRGTPLMLQLFVIFYMPGYVFKQPNIDRFLSAVIAFSLNYAAYFAVIYKGGLQGVPRGQYEACKLIGLNRRQTLGLVIVPQVGKRIIQPMSNEVITLIKDTSLANVISVAEIILVGQSISSTTTSIFPLMFTGVFYLVFVGILTVVFHLIEKKLDYYKL